MKKTSFNNVENCDTKSLEFLQWILGLYKLGQNTEFRVEKSEIFQSILVYIVNGFDADTGSLAFLTEDGTELQIIAGIDLPDGVVGSKVPVNESRMGAIIRSNEPSLFNDINKNTIRTSYQFIETKFSIGVCIDIRDWTIITI